MKRFELAFDTCPVPMLLVASCGEIVKTNALFDALFEYPEGELIGKPVEVLVPEAVRSAHPDLRAAFMRVPMRRAMGRGRELSGVTAEGRIIPLELGLDPVDVDGETFALVAAVDISRRKVMEERINLVIDAAASAILMVNEQGMIVFANNPARALFGYALGELVGQSVERLVPDRFARAHAVYRRSFQANPRRRPMGPGSLVTGRHKSGREIPVEIALTPADTAEGRMIMCTIIDLTERAAAEAERERKNRELELLNLELSSFANSASHDLKAPLASITGLLGICIEDLDAGDLGEARRVLSEALEISQRSAAKVDNILAIARAGRDVIPAESFSVAEELHDIWHDLTAAAKLPPELKLELAHADPVVTERPTFTTIMENLLSNAIRYGDPAKPRHEIQVSSREASGALRISVTDNGVGIPERNLDRVFRMFDRLDERSGDGMGLNLVRKQIERLGGEIWVKSEEGAGTEFSFTLPLREAKSAAAAAE